LVAAANAYLRSKFKTQESLVADYVPSGLYFGAAALLHAGVDEELAQQALADFGRSCPGVAYAITRSELLHGRLPDTALMRSVQRAFHPERSGDVTLIQQQFWYMDAERDRYATTHGSPYSYDTFVPMIFAGPGIKPRVIARDVEPASIAPTLAAVLHIKPPSGSSAKVLQEVLDH
jgi:hypothetical protein